MANAIQQDFVPVSIHIKEQPAMFKRFDAVWTPTVLVLDAGGKERYRIEGYLGKTEFAAQIALSLGRLALMQKRWDEAATKYEDVVKRYPISKAAPEALYWAGVSRYRITQDHHVLEELARQFGARYQDSLWAEKASVWG